MGDVSHVTSIGYDEIEDNSYNDYNLLQLFHAGVRPNGQTTETTFVARSAQRAHALFLLAHGLCDFFEHETCRSPTDQREVMTRI